MLVVFALVFTSCAEPTADVRTTERSSCEATRSKGLVRASKRVDASVPVARSHSKDRKLVGLAGQAFALEEPDRVLVCARRWHVCLRLDAALLAHQSARAPPHS